MAIFISPRMNSLSAAEAQIQDFNKQEMAKKLRNLDKPDLAWSRIGLLSSSPLAKNQASGIDFKAGQAHI